MRILIYILFLSIFVICFGATEPQTGWSYDQTMLQAFYIFDAITIDGLVVEGDGTGEEGECYTSGTCDVIGAFRRGVCSDPVYQFSQQLCEINDDYTLKEDSPCIDAGIVVGGIEYSGSAPDMDAYELL